MPIYSYRCKACGFAKDALQKVSDAPLTVCPSCDKAAFEKQLTAAGFQLKGSGWYVTDFRNGSGGKGVSAENTASTSQAGTPEQASASSPKTADSSSSSDTPASGKSDNSVSPTT